jgi:threonine aldolase
MTESQDPTPFWKWQFASDNTAPMCPEAMEAMNQANADWSPSYGEDPWTEKAKRRIQDFFETDCSVYFVFSGSAANALILSHYCQPYHGVICSPTAHVETDEACGPEFSMGGGKLMHVEGPNGKVDPEGIGPVFARGHDIHSPKPRVLSITQSTEMGTVYTPEELGRLNDIAKARDLVFHMDGARFFNAVEALGVAPAEISWKAGLDSLSLGATKNGGPVCEALVFFKTEGLEEMEWRRKMAGQLASKQRYLSAPFYAMVQPQVWSRNAGRANTCARQLADGLTEIEGVSLRFPVEANAVFLEMPEALARGLWDLGWHFYPFFEVSAYRLMCSWNTDTTAIDALLSDARAVAAKNEVGRVETGGGEFPEKLKSAILSA